MASWASKESPGLSRLSALKTSKFSVMSRPEKAAGPPPMKRRDHMISIEQDVQKAWAANGAFEANAEDDDRKKFFVTFPRVPGVF